MSAPIIWSDLTPIQREEILAAHRAWALNPATGACLDLRGANLSEANLRMANLSGVNLSEANLRMANLSGANLSEANLRWANLSEANLSGVNLSEADIRWVNLSGADLREAVLPDGRVWEAYRADHMAGICDAPDVRARAIAAWGEHSWGTCPMSMAYGWKSVPTGRLDVAAWVALYDAGLLERPAGVAS